MILPRVVCVVGPTSSGKTALAVVLARQCKGEIVSADARQLYRGFDIGTGKPSLSDRQGVPHHLFAEDPRVPMTVSEWRARALACIHDIVGREALPILVGGTGLYLQALIDHLALSALPPQLELREELSRVSHEERVERLRRVDPQAARIIDLRNPRRVLRALEVASASGHSFVAVCEPQPPLVEAVQIGVRRTRQELYARADQAVDDMLERGWLDEVRGLLAQGFSTDHPAMSALGYREFASVLAGRSTLLEVLPLIKQATRHYIKRQITWFKRDPRIHWVTSEKEAIIYVLASQN